jgi:ribosomal protein S18 acetylase RimI-like enzyme
VASSLRSFEERDRSAVLELSRHALQRPEEQVGNPLWTTSEELESELSDWDVPPEETLIVEEADGEIVGFGGVEVSPGFEHADLFGPLVAAGYRGRKLGTTILEASVERAENQGARKVIASVGAHNKGGRLLLARAGFHAFGSAHAVFRLHPADHRPAGPGPEGVSVRRGQPADIEETVRLYRACFPDGVFPESAWQEALERGAVYIGEAQEESLAVVNIDPSDRWIYHLGVVESERDQGLGSHVLSYALTDYWRTHPGEILGLTVHAENVPALRLYRKQGFAPLLILQSFELPL